uniref:Uncharacterized protein n=1 Tax=Biomphalaria glabrata TaxID=6526 RepID=A0A2C9M7I2_BIOGL
PAFICPFNEKEIKANVYDTVYIGFQVLAYPNITSVVVTKSANLNTKDTNWTVEIIELSRVFWYLELSKDILQENDFDNYTVWVTSNVNLSVSKNFTLFVKDNLLNNSSSTEDYCTNETSTVLYRIVKSGLPVLLSSNMSESYVTEILPNKLASEYLIKVYLRNCTQHIGKVETLTLQAGSKFVTISFNAKEKYFNLSSCAPTIQETTLMISIGENVELNMCVISNTLIKGENVGFNKIASSDFSIFKHSVEIKKENNQQIIILTIKNITRDDIKFYQVRIRDTLKGTVTFVFNLKLKE